MDWAHHPHQEGSCGVLTSPAVGVGPVAIHALPQNIQHLVAVQQHQQMTFNCEIDPGVAGPVVMLGHQIDSGVVREDDGGMLPLLHQSVEQVTQGAESEAKLDDVVAKLKTILPAWVEDIGRMIKRYPKLARADPEVLAQRLRRLEELLPMQTAELAKIVRAQPSLVNHSPEALAGTVNQLRELVPSDVDVGYLLSSRPILLKQSAKTLETNWKSLHEHAALVPRWKQELELFSKRRSTALGNLLLYGRKKHARLARVANLAPALRDRYALSTIFNMKDDAFEEKFDESRFSLDPLIVAQINSTPTLGGATAKVKKTKLNAGVSLGIAEPIPATNALPGLGASGETAARNVFHHTLSQQVEQHHLNQAQPTSPMAVIHETLKTLSEDQLRRGLTTTADIELQGFATVPTHDMMMMQQQQQQLRQQQQQKQLEQQQQQQQQLQIQLQLQEQLHKRQEQERQQRQLQKEQQALLEQRQNVIANGNQAVAENKSNSLLPQQPPPPPPPPPSSASIISDVAPAAIMAAVPPLHVPGDPHYAPHPGQAFSRVAAAAAAAGGGVPSSSPSPTSFAMDLAGPASLDIPTSADDAECEHKPKKRPRGAAREPNCPKCDNPKCHKSHTYTHPCQRAGQNKPVRAKPKQDEKKMASKQLLSGEPLVLIPHHLVVDMNNHHHDPHLHQLHLQHQQQQQHHLGVLVDMHEQQRQHHLHHQHHHHPQHDAHHYDIQASSLHDPSNMVRSWTDESTSLMDQAHVDAPVDLTPTLAPQPMPAAHHVPPLLQVANSFFSAPSDPVPRQRYDNATLSTL